MSVRATSTSMPDAPSSSASERSRSSRRAASATRAPAAPNARAVATPIPLDAPVTTTLLPRSALDTPAPHRSA